MALKIMPLGDSITFGIINNATNQYDVGDQNMLGSGGLFGYRRDLYIGLAATLGKENVIFVGDFASRSAVLTDPFFQARPGIYTDELRTGKEKYPNREHNWDNSIFADKFPKVDKEFDDPIGTKIKHYDPDVVLLMIGSNDVNDVMNLTTGSGLNAAKTLAGTRATSAVGSLIDDINSTIGNDGQKFGGQIFVGTVPPFENGTKYTVDENEVAKSWNIAVETLISDKYANSNVHFVDMWKQSAPYVDPFTVEKDTVGGLTQLDITDFGSKIGQDQCGCHPTYDGYIKIAKHWYAALQQVVPELNPGYAPLAKLLSGGALAEVRPDLNQGDAGLSTLSLELQEYLPSVQGGQPLVGFDGADLGQGKGDGVDEVVAFLIHPLI